MNAVHDRCAIGLWCLIVLCKVMADSVYALRYLSASTTTIEERVTYFSELSSHDFVFSSSLTGLDELIPIRNGSLVPKSSKVSTGYRINHLLPDLDADLAVLVQDGVRSYAQVYASKTVV